MAAASPTRQPAGWGAHQTTQSRGDGRAVGDFSAGRVWSVTVVPSPSSGWTPGDFSALWVQGHRHRPSLWGPTGWSALFAKPTQTSPAHDLCLPTERRTVSLLGVTAQAPSYLVKWLWVRKTNLVCWWEAATLRFSLCRQSQEPCRTLHQCLPQTRHSVWRGLVCLKGRWEGWKEAGERAERQGWARKQTKKH